MEIKTFVWAQGVANLVVFFKDGVTFWLSFQQIMGDDRDGDKDDHDGGDKEVEEQRRNHIRQLREWIEQCRVNILNDTPSKYSQFKEVCCRLP